MMNINGKSALVIGGSALLAGAAIIGIDKAAKTIKAKKNHKKATETKEEVKEAVANPKVVEIEKKEEK